VYIELKFESETHFVKVITVCISRCTVSTYRKTWSLGFSLQSQSFLFQMF